MTVQTSTGVGNCNSCVLLYLCLDVEKIVTDSAFGEIAIEIYSLRIDGAAILQEGEAMLNMALFVLDCRQHQMIVHVVSLCVMRVEYGVSYVYCIYEGRHFKHDLC